MQEDNDNVANDKLHREGIKRSFSVHDGESKTIKPFVPVGDTMNTTDNTAIGNDMMAVARRIRERAQLLKDEKQKAESLRAVLLDLRDQQKTEIAINNRQRRRLLQATIERNEVELELFEVQESIDHCQKQARTMDQEIQESEERIHTLGERRAEQAVSFYGPNMAKMDTYIKVFEDIVESKQKAVEARQKRLEELRTKIKQSKTKEEEILCETREIQDIIDRQEEIDDESENDTKVDMQSKRSKHSDGIRKEDEEIIALASNVREAISAVRELYCTLSKHSLFSLLFLSFFASDVFKNLKAVFSPQETQGGPKEIRRGKWRPIALGGKAHPEPGWEEIVTEKEVFCSICHCMNT